MSVEQQIIKSFKANLDHLYAMLHFIKSYAKSMGFSEVPLSRIELASEEALVNIIEYAYPDTDEGPVQIRLNGLGTNDLSITIIDNGIPFNPLANTKKFQIKSFKTNPTIGGYGTYFIVELMDRVEYDRKGEANILTLVKTKESA